MKHRFSVGDRVRIIQSLYTHMIGREAIITSGLESADEGGDYAPGTPLHELDLASETPGWVVAYPPEWLEPIYDGNQKIAWSDMADLWRPTGVDA